MNAVPTQTQIDQFHSEGNLVVEDVLSEEVLTALRAEYSTLIDEVAERLFAAGRLSSSFDGLLFEDKFVCMLAKYSPDTWSTQVVKLLEDDLGTDLRAPGDDTPRIER